MSAPTAAELAAQLEIYTRSAVLAAEGEPICRAVIAFVDRLPIVTDAAPPPEEWPADVTLGALVLAFRLWRRRDSPLGVASLGGDATAYVTRTDPDVASLLGLTRPAVG